MGSEAKEYSVVSKLNLEPCPAPPADAVHTAHLTVPQNERTVASVATVVFSHMVSVLQGEVAPVAVLSTQYPLVSPAAVITIV